LSTPSAIALDPRKMAVTVRFAPSPTGYLHVGNARTALVNWLFARKAQGRFLLRFDDTDVERASIESERAIVEDLRWLGLEPDLAFRQSERIDLYAVWAERLKALGRLYPCYETPEELALKRKIAALGHQPPIYDRAALGLRPSEKAKYEAEGRRPHWRFLLEHREVAWDDLLRGPVAINAGTVSDPVLLRQDGVPLYALSSVVDDIEFGVTHIIRGEDHVTNTAAQIQLFEAFNAPWPQFAHLALLVGARGEGLAKRLKSLSLGELRARGIEPMALASHLARLGTAKPIEPVQTLSELAAGFDLGDFGRAPARFDVAELEALNAKFLHRLPYAMVRERLPEGADEAFWLAVRGNIRTLNEVRDWWRIVEGPVEPVIEDGALIAAARELLPAGVFDERSWTGWTRAIAAATGRKGRALYRPLRLALTGREQGPEMHNLLPLIGRERTLERLSRSAA
jgi:glutamyl-tRNA synthetase